MEHEPTRSFRLQLLTALSGPTVTDLLLFVDQLVAQDGRIAKARWWANGWHRPDDPRSNVPELVRLLALERFNQAEVEVVTKKPRRTIGGWAVRKALCALSVSPTNRMWAEVVGYRSQRRADEDLRSSFESRENALRWNSTTVCPSILEMVCECEGLAENDDEAARQIWEGFPTSLLPSEVWAETWGCADLREELIFQPNVLEELAPWPRSYSMLSPSRFDDLHALLLGDQQAVSDLAAEIDQSRVRTIDAGDSKPLSLAWFPGSRDRAARRAKAARWLVPRDASTARVETRPDEGEFRVGAHTIYLRRRYDELRRQGRLPQLPSGHRFFDLFDREVCEKLGIDPQEMPVELWQDRLIDLAQKEIAANFSALGDGIPLATRIWQAHEATYRKWLYGRDARLKWLEGRFLEAAERGRRR